MAGTPLASAIRDLFEGRVRSYLRCLDVEYRSERCGPNANLRGLTLCFSTCSDELFSDISCDVRGFATLDASLDGVLPLSVSVCR